MLKKIPTSDREWLEVFRSLSSSLSGLQTEISDLKSMRGKIDHVDTRKPNIDSKLCDLDDEVQSHGFRINWLTFIIIKQEERIAVLENRQSRAYERETRNNIMIHGIFEDKDETVASLSEKVAKFFKESMKIEESIEVVDLYRTGHYTKRDRPIMLKLRHIMDKGIIFKHASNLKGLKNVRKQLFQVHDDETEERSDFRKYYRDLQAENKDRQEEDKLQIKMSKGKIMVNNEVLKPIVQMPKTADLLRMQETELEIIRATKLVAGEEHIEKGSEFYSCAQKIKSKEDVKKGLSKLKVKYADSTDILCGYVLQNPNGPYNQGYIDDGEIGQGRNILKSLKEKASTETAVYIIRYYGGNHLGARCFEIAKDLALSAQQNLKVKKRRRGRDLRQSAESIDSFFTDVSRQSDIQSDQESQVSQPEEIPT